MKCTTNQVCGSSRSSMDILVHQQPTQATTCRREINHVCRSLHFSADSLSSRQISQAPMCRKEGKHEPDTYIYRLLGRSFSISIDCKFKWMQRRRATQTKCVDLLAAGGIAFCLHCFHLCQGQTVQTHIYTIVQDGKILQSSESCENFR